MGSKELGIFAKNDLVAEILLITGSPRLVQALISGDVEVVPSPALRARPGRGYAARMWRYWRDG